MVCLAGLTGRSLQPSARVHDDGEALGNHPNAETRSSKLTGLDELGGVSGDDFRRICQSARVHVRTSDGAVPAGRVVCQLVPAARLSRLATVNRPAVPEKACQCASLLSWEDAGMKLTWVGIRMRCHEAVSRQSASNQAQCRSTTSGMNRSKASLQKPVCCAHPRVIAHPPFRTK